MSREHPLVTGRRLAHLLLAVAGLLIAAYPFTLGANPTPTCRGVAMRPGETCAKADGSAEQTYEERRAAAQGAEPVIVGIGVLVAVFAAGLFVADVRRTRADRDQAPQVVRTSALADPEQARRIG